MDDEPDGTPTLHGSADPEIKQSGHMACIRFAPFCSFRPQKVLQIILFRSSSRCRACTGKCRWRKSYRPGGDNAEK